MTPETEMERRANFICRNSYLYGSDSDFKNMADNTVYLTPEQKRASEQYVLRAHGTCNDQFAELRYLRVYGT